MSRKLRDVFVIGLALFSIFFGAGNLMFPPILGLHSGDAWVPAVLGLGISGILMPIFALVVISYAGGSIKKMTAPIHKNFYKVLMGLVYLSSAFITIPRTGAVAIELGIQGIFGSVPRVPFVILFFGLAFFVSMSKGKVVDRLGKVLTPLLISILAVLIIKSILTPMGVPNNTGIANAFTYSFIGGYQTGDLLTSFMMANLIIGGIVAKGYESDKERCGMTLKIGIVCTVCLFAVYAALLYMGACGSELFPQDMERAKLLLGLIKGVSGQVGVWGLGIAVFLACFTTAVGELTAASDFFEELTDKKVSYRTWLIICAISAFFVASMGIERIVEVTAPFFETIYPVCTTILLLGLFHRVIRYNGSYQGAILFTLIYSIYSEVLIKVLNVHFLSGFITSMPLYNYGFGWLLPAIIGLVIGTAFSKLQLSVYQHSKV